MLLFIMMAVVHFFLEVLNTSNFGNPGQVKKMPESFETSQHLILFLTICRFIQT